MRTALRVALAVAPMIWLATPAAAAPTTSLHVTPTTVTAGGSVLVSGTCEANTNGFALSHAFLHDASHDFAGVGAASFQTDASGAFAVTAQVPASIPPGNYDVTGRCGGGNLGISVTLTVVAAATPPTAVPAGSGGLAATRTGGSDVGPLLVGGIGVALVVLGGLGMSRRSTRRGAMTRRNPNTAPDPTGRRSPTRY
jgi:hypothetical protein